MINRSNDADISTHIPAEAMNPLGDPAAWKCEELANNEDWQFKITATEIEELEDATESVLTRGLDIKDITLKDFPLPSLDAKLAEVRDQIINGKGIAVLRGVPVDLDNMERNAIAYWGIGLRVGTPVSQNYKGHLLGHVADLIGPSRENPNQRAYHTSAHLDYHSDSCDVVVLYCLHAAKSGGTSTIASSATIYNEMLERRPDLVEELIKPWFRDRREEIPPGKGPWFELPVFNFAAGYFSASWQNFYIRSAQRFEELPRFTDSQVEALDLVNSLADEFHHNMDFKPGDIQFLHNHVTVHARSAYEDWPEPERRRHLLRLWLATPGGRPLPDAYLDRYVGLKPGQRPSGIVVENMELSTPLVPE